MIQTTPEVHAPGSADRPGLAALPMCRHAARAHMAAGSAPDRTRSIGPATGDHSVTSLAADLGEQASAVISHHTAGVAA